MVDGVNASTAANQSQVSNRRYRLEIDGLRAFAVIAVIINHFGKDLLPRGYLGVDFFCDLWLCDDILARREAVKRLQGFLEWVL